MRKVAGSNPGRTKNQGLKTTGKIMLAVCSTSASVYMIALLGGDVKPLALSPTFVSLCTAGLITNAYFG